MSQLLGRIATKLSSSHELCFRKLRSLSTAATPYLLFKETNCRMARTTYGGGGGEMVVDLNLYDPRKEERVKIPDQILHKELESSVKFGSSRGWVGMKNLLDRTIRLTNIYNPCASVSSHKVITLPPLSRSNVLISSISLSASPEQQGCVVAVKSFPSLVSLCRPGDSDWTHIEIPCLTKEIMYSVKDSKFYLHRVSKKEDEGPVDLIKTSSSFPQVSLYQRFTNSDIPQSRKDQVTSATKTQHLVQSPSGDSFMVYWYNEFLKKEDIESTVGNVSPFTPSYRSKPRGFVVFKQDPEQRIGSYTEDIGDLCIFLSYSSEAFCVSASEYPGLNPNSIYYGSLRTGFGFYDLSSNTLHDVIDEYNFDGTYQWLAPLSG